MYPRKARANGVEGKVIYTCEVNKSGKLENIKLVQSVSPEIDSAAKACLIIALDALPKPYNPAILNGKPVRSRIEHPIIFKLQ
jgi:protein TonB